MTSKELNLQLIKYIPEIKELYDDEVVWQEQDDTGSHTVFGDVLVPYTLEKIAENDIKSLNTIFDGIERLLNLKDDYADEVITLSVLERISEEKALSDKIYKYMGEYTKKTFEILSAKLGEEYNLD